METKKLESLLEVVKEKCGNDISIFEDSFLIRLIQIKAAEANKSEPDFLRWLEGHHDECQIFLDSLKITYSEFFRNLYSYEIIQNVVLPDLYKRNTVEKKITTKLWSAACGAGQEVYSLSIIFQEFNSKNKNSFKYHITGTDIAESEIIKANFGNYHTLALKNVNMGRITEFFTKHRQFYTIRNRLKEHTFFSVFDLLDSQHNYPPESLFGDFDLIVCANVLYYYKPEIRNIILKKLVNNLKTGGYLVVDPVEREYLQTVNFKEIIQDSCIFQKLN